VQLNQCTGLGLAFTVVIVETNHPNRQKITSASFQSLGLCNDYFIPILIVRIVPEGGYSDSGHCRHFGGSATGSATLLHVITGIEPVNLVNTSM
jgi:hypothetical protein